MPLVIPLAIGFGSLVIGTAIIVSVEQLYRKHTALRQAEAIINTAVLDGKLVFTDDKKRIPQKELKEKMAIVHSRSRV